MERIVELILTPEQAYDRQQILHIASVKAGIDLQSVKVARIVNHSVDSRQRNIKIYLKVLFSDSDSNLPSFNQFTFKNTINAPEVLIVGTGPAGLFAAMRCLELGLKPVIIERGKNVSDRKRDIAAIHRNQPLNEESNYAFGEGGAGAFSDGKLYTRSHKRGDINRILNLFFLHGADESVLYDSHPHIGTDRLPSVIANIRKTITGYGGEFHFGQKIIDLEIKQNKFQGVKTAAGLRFNSPAIILATGHSARDIYQLILRKQIHIQPKGFAMGVRVEHPQELINRIQYHNSPQMKYLPAASYSLVCQAAGRGVYSFCMCPGGFIVPASTSAGEIVVNGMSPSKRNSPFANSGIVVEIRPDDYKSAGITDTELPTLQFQQHFEQLARIHGAEFQIAPAQRLVDFLAGKSSSILPVSSFKPALISSPLHEWIPFFISSRLKEAFTVFDKKMKGFISDNAVIVGVESRTSSPVRIIRDIDTFMHPQVSGLFPAGEGAGYAGGIVSSAIDGQRCADAVARFLQVV